MTPNTPTCPKCERSIAPIRTKQMHTYRGMTQVTLSVYCCGQCGAAITITEDPEATERALLIGIKKLLGR